MKKLNIAMLTTFYPPYSFGGDAIGIQRLATAIAKQGHQVTVIHDIDAFSTLSNTTPTEIGHPENINVIGLKCKIGFISNLLTQQLGHPIVHRKQLQQILAPGAFDIIWFHNISLIGGPALLSFGNGLKIYEAHEHWLVCPTHVLWRHNKERCDGRQCLRCSINYRRPPQLWRYQNFFTNQLNHVDTFIAKSEFSRDKHKEFGFPKNMQVVPYFLPETPEYKHKHNAPPHNKPYFLFVGRLEKIKGLDDVLPVFKSYPSADLLILGTGEHEASLRQQAVGIPNVKFLGRLAPDELSRYYKSAIALIVPSVCYETFGIILIESFKEGTPVIARRLGPFVEIVDQCKGGLLYSNNKELVEAMHRLQENSSYRQTMSNRARSGFEKHWSEKAVLNKYFNVIRQTALKNGNDYVASALKNS